LKGVTDDDKRDAAAGWQLSSRSSRRAGTKRRRVIKSGADDMLELEGGAEEDESEEGDLPGRGHYLSHRLDMSGGDRSSGFPKVDCQAMGIDPIYSSFRPSIASRWHACCGLLTAASGGMLRCYGE